MKKQISKTNKKRLMAYCSAASVGAFAANQSASAAVNFTDLSSSPITLGPAAAGYFNDSIGIDLDGGGNDLAFGVYSNPNDSAYSVRVSPQANVLSNGIAGGYFGDPIIAFNLGDTIGPNNPTAYGTIGDNPFLSAGNINNFPADKYLGVKLESGNYGWVALEIDTSFNDIPNHHGLTITGYAFEDSGAAISAGSTVPEPATYAFGLSLLALGAVGVKRWRQGSKSST